MRSPEPAHPGIEDETMSESTWARSTKWPRILVSIVIVAALAAPAAAGDLDAEIRVGTYTDVGETYVGAGLLAAMAPSNWMFNPNLEYVLVDRGDLATLNADFHYDVVSSDTADLWMGAGVALVMRDNDRGSNETDLGFNLLAGVGFLHHQPVRPFLQAKLLLEDGGSEGVITFGLRFF